MFAITITETPSNSDISLEMATTSLTTAEQEQLASEIQDALDRWRSNRTLLSGS